MEARAQLNWSLTDAAILQQVNKSTLSRIENHPGYMLSMNLLRLIQLFSIYKQSFVEAVTHMPAEQIEINPGGTVVLIDDMSTHLMIYEKLIRKYFRSVEVLTYKNPKDALEWLKVNQARLIITDYSMPELNGFELLHRLNKTEINRYTPSILMTDKAEFEMIKRAQKQVAGFSFSSTMFWHKRRPKPELISLIRDVLVFA